MNNTTIFLLCRAVSRIGDEMQSVVMPILILEMTKSGKSFASFIGVQDLFMLLIMVLSGYLADSFNRKRSMVICDFINGSITLLFLIFFKENFYYILVFQLSQMVFSKIFAASSSSLLVEIAPKDILLKTSALLEMTNKLISLLAPATALFIYSRLGIKPILIINILSYFISGFFECFIAYEHKRLEKIENIVTSYFSLFEYLKSKRKIVIFFIFSCFINTFANPILTIIFPYTIKIDLKLSSEYIGYLYLCISIGMLLGSFFIQNFSKVNLYNYIPINGIFMFTLLLIISTSFKFFINVFFFYLCIAFFSILLGFVNALFNIPIFTYFNLNVDNKYLSRFYSLNTILGLGLTPISFFITGVLISKYDSFIISLSYLLILFVIYIGVFYVKKFNFDFK